MKFNKYQKDAERTLKHSGLAMPALGLTGEAGEVSDLIKKHLFHGHELDREKVCDELGDVLWYISAMCTSLGVELEYVADKNIKKLKRRYPDGFSEDRSKNREDE